MWNPVSLPEVVAYTVSYSSSSDNSSQTIQVNSCRSLVVINNLEAGEEYQVQMQAVVEVDREKFFSEISVITGKLSITT